MSLCGLKFVRDNEEVDPRKMLTKGKEATKAAVREKMRLFNSCGKA